MPVILLQSFKKKSGQSISYGCVVIILCHIKHTNYGFWGRNGLGELNWLVALKILLLEIKLLFYLF